MIKKDINMKKQTILPDVVCKIEKSGNRFNAWSTDGVKMTSEITSGCRKNAFNGDYLIGRFPSTNGNKGTSWRRVTDKVLALMENSPSQNSPFNEPSVSIDVPTDHAEVLAFIHGSYSLKPKGLMMSELKWKYLIRSAVRGKNIMMTGPAGCGKTMAAKCVVNALDRPDYYFNLGATQDPRSTLIGNTHFDSKNGTFFSKSLFVEAIQTPNAVILLDELSRAHPDAWNILMTVLDYGQRYLRVDEADNSETIKVADGVTFVATANIGNEYTSTRVMDKALMDRFTIVEMDVLTEDDEKSLLSYMFPHVDGTLLSNVAKIATLTRTESNSDTARISSGISTRTTVELCGLLYDEFSLEEAAEVSIYPQYDSSGGVDSERTFVKQIVQKFCDDGSSEDLFNEDEMEQAEADNS
jgi:nitric oxide reductase NorQ protein|tara:strand:+ start:3061 stop:4293 length:1233 start_codon:yes stop_codon:yes gene_type:complete